MESLTFNLQIDMFLTNTDDWENQDSFWCAYNEGYFRNTQSGNSSEWKNIYWRIGKVEKNRYNSYDLIREHNNRVYRTQDEALEILKQLENK